MKTVCALFLPLLFLIGCENGLVSSGERSSLKNSNTRNYISLNVHIDDGIAPFGLDYDSVTQVIYTKESLYIYEPSAPGGSWYFDVNLINSAAISNGTFDLDAIVSDTPDYIEGVNWIYIDTKHQDVNITNSAVTHYGLSDIYFFQTAK